MGIITPETNPVEKRVPADPGVPDSAEQIITQAGQVWYPDSAAKTVAALEEFRREGLPVYILANWRGFSGGCADLFGGVLQNGAEIVEQLRTYPAPVTVYLAPGTELRGGAWVVLDKQINPHRIEVVADPTARGGVLEPEGMVEIKLRAKEQLKLMHALDHTLRALARSDGSPADRDRQISISQEAKAAIRAREEVLRPAFLAVALAFAEMHDTPARMRAKGAVDHIVPYVDVRRVLGTRLRARCGWDALLASVLTAAPPHLHAEVRRKLKMAMAAAREASPSPGRRPRRADEDDRAEEGEGEDEDAWVVVAWAEGDAGRAAVKSVWREVQRAEAGRALREVLGEKVDVAAVTALWAEGHHAGGPAARGEGRGG